MGDHQLGSVLDYLRRLTRVPDADTLTDRQLLQRFAAQHDQHAFAALVERHGPMVLRVCRRALADAPDADDAFQATFLVLARKARSSAWQESVGPWLYAVAFRTALKARAEAARRRSHERQGCTPAEGAARAHDGDPVAEVGRRELHRLLDEELGRLPSKYRDPLVLCYLEGKTNEEAARELGRPVGSMSRHLTRGRELLRERLAHRGVTLSLGLLGAALAGEASAAAVPGALRDLTVRSALIFVQGGVATGRLSAGVVALTEGVLQAMQVTKVKLAAALALAVVVLGGTGGWLYRAGAKPALEEPARPVAGTTGTAAAGSRAPGQFQDAKHARLAPRPGPDVNKREAKATKRASVGAQASELRARLNAPVVFDVPPGATLKDALDHIKEVYGIPTLIDARAFNDDPDNPVPEVESTPVRLPKLTNMPARTILQLLLEPVGGTYLVRPGYLEITTWRHAWPAAWAAMDRHLVPAVDMDFHQLPLDQALTRLADATGLNVVLDGRVQNEARTAPVTAHFSRVPLDTAVQLLADMAGLKSVALDNVLYVTTPANADALEARQQKRQPKPRPVPPKK